MSEQRLCQLVIYHSLVVTRSYLLALTGLLSEPLLLRPLAELPRASESSRPKFGVVEPRLLLVHCSPLPFFAVCLHLGRSRKLFLPWCHHSRILNRTDLVQKTGRWSDHMAVKARDSDTLVLIQRGKSGDENALNALFARHQERVLRIVRLRLTAELREKLKVQSMDILQDVFLRAFEKLKDFEPKSQGAFLHWLSRIVGNVILDKLDYVWAQKRACLAEVSLDRSIVGSMDHMRLGDLIPNQGTSPTQHAIKQGIKTAVDELLLELDEQEREVIIQRKLEGLTFGEMASETGKTEDAVRKQFNRSFQKLISLAETRHLLQELRL